MAANPQPNPELARHLLAAAEEIERLTREHFQLSLRHEVREQAKQKRFQELERRSKAKRHWRHS